MNTAIRWIIGLILLALVVLVVYAFLHRNEPSPPAPSINTYGMSKYTDPTYGFTFWYPSELLVSATSTNDTMSFPGGTAVETIQVGSPGGVALTVVDSPDGTITDEPNDHASPIAQTKYFYDFATGQWMVTFPEGTNTGNPGATTTVGTTKTTVSGLAMFPSGRRFDTTIIPLSTTQFLVVSDGGGSSFTPQLAATVATQRAEVNGTILEPALSAESSAYAQQ